MGTSERNQLLKRLGDQYGLKINIRDLDAHRDLRDKIFEAFPVRKGIYYEGSFSDTEVLHIIDLASPSTLSSICIMFDALMTT